jgi:hypothetical protein
MNGVFYTALSWLVYAVWGLIVALLNGEKFDAKKFTRSLLWAMLITLLALITQLEPIQVTTKYGTLIDSLLALLMNSSPTIALMWFFERLYLAIRAIAKHIKQQQRPNMVFGE